MLDPMIVDAGRMYPMRCACGTSTGPLIDTHAEFDQYHIYICVRCAKTHGRLIGMVPGDETEDLRIRLVAAEAKAAALEIKLADAEPILRSLGRAYAEYGVDD